MKKCVFTAIAGVLSIAGLTAAPAYDRTLYVDFEKSNGALSAWPRKFATAGKLVKGDAVSGVQAFKITPNGQVGSFYFGYPSHLYSGGFRFSRPGVIQVSFNHKAGDSDQSKMTLAVNFNKKGKGNGSNGSRRVEVPSSGKEYKNFFANIFVPDETFVTQIVMGFSGGSVLLDDLKVSYIGDTVVMPRSKYNGNLNLKLSDTFYNPNYRLFGFYERTAPSRLNTEVRLASDPQGLYVIFINPDDPAKLKAVYTGSDESLWNDDCNEVFIFSPEQNIGWQFIVNANGAKTDLQLVQRVPGDPFRPEIKWNGSWKAVARKDGKNWETRFFIPWKTLNLTGKGKINLKINLAREAKIMGENSSFNCGNFGFSDINGFADLLIDDTSMTIKRTRTDSRISYSVKRTTPLSSIVKPARKGCMKSNFWGNIYYPTTFGKAIQSRFPREVLDKYQQEMIRSMGESGSAGPQYPWSVSLVRGGLAEMEAYQAKYGRGMLFAMFNSDIGRAARRNGATLLYLGNDHAVDPIDPAYVKAGVDFITRYAKNKNFQRIVKNTAVMRGLDEPTNYVNHAFNRKHNINNQATLDKIDAAVKAQYGFNKYGLPNFDNSSNTQEYLKRIAFFRWWHDEYRKSLEAWTKVVRDNFPGVIWHMTNANTVSGQSALDLARYDGMGDELSCDPYPTSTNALFGMERAIYHTGYSVKIVHDIAPKSTTQAILQGFIYHGGAPSASDLREWASQAVKNGARSIEWYIDSSIFNMFEEYVVLLNIMRQINDMEYIVPQNLNPKSGIWYSNYDVWATGDMATHAAYSIYSILGEQLKSDFRFINDTMLRNNSARLNELKVLYIPKMKFTDPDTSKALTDWVKKGGRLVVFDPEFMIYNIDGSKSAARKELTGAGDAVLRKLPKREISWKNKVLKVSVLRNDPEISSEYPVKAYDVQKPADAKVIATYPDGKPAAFERRVGKGSVVYFAVQPFGCSDLAVNGGSWCDFFKAEAVGAGEKINVARWDFLLPEAPKVVKLDPVK